jgi:hypothetical protein
MEIGRIDDERITHSQWKIFVEKSMAFRAQRKGWYPMTSCVINGSQTGASLEDNYIFISS